MTGSDVEKRLKEINFPVLLHTLRCVICSTILYNFNQSIFEYDVHAYLMLELPGLLVLLEVVVLEVHEDAALQLLDSLLVHLHRPAHEIRRKLKYRRGPRDNLVNGVFRPSDQACWIRLMYVEYEIYM